MKYSAILSTLAAAGAVSAQANPTTTPAACPAAGETNAAGDYGCNPNREYPGQACALIGDCYILRGLGLLTTSSNGVQPTPGPVVCPAAGETNAVGDYGCNPNREYPDQVCALINDCYILRGLGLASTTTKSVKTTPGPYSSINTGKPPQPTTFVPVSRNVTSVINGVTTVVPVGPSSVVKSAYTTTGPDGALTTVPAQTVPAATGGPNGGPNGGPTDGPTAGGAHLSVAGGLAALAFAAALV